MKRLIITFTLIIALLLVGCGANTDMNSQPPKGQTAKIEYMVLIGEDPSIVNKVGNMDVLVIDASFFTKDEIQQLRNNNIGKVYSYLNVGSIETFRSFYEDFEQLSIGDYENWPEERWIDVSNTQWQEFILDEADKLVQKDIDGFFVDNADIYYLYTNNEIYNGLVDILSGLRAFNKPIYINGGDIFVSQLLESGDNGDIFDGVNQECVYTTYDFDVGCCLENTEAERQYYTEYLDMLTEEGYQVYVTEYATDPEITARALSYSKEHNYVCYVSDNIELRTP